MTRDDTFSVTYLLTGPSPGERARSICIEQTVEFPEDLVTDPFIRGQVFGEVASLDAVGPESTRAVIRYRSHVAGGELTQLLNVLFGNVSLLPGIRVERLELSDAQLAGFRGPRFGRAGLRALLGVAGRPLLCTAVKPMGLSPETLADMAYRYALGGIDLIKDDHGLADQAFCRFEPRVEACAAAVARANQETGGRSLYLPNVTGPADRVMERARFAKAVGAGGLLVAPGLTGFDAMRQLADDDALGLPILMHPALLGSFVTRPTDGIGHFALFGQIARISGADATIFPSYGGRFSFSRDECRELASGTVTPMGHLQPIFPVPAGGLRVDRVPELRAFYGDDVMLLIGGDLHRADDLVAACRRFRQLVGGPATEP